MGQLLGSWRHYMASQICVNVNSGNGVVLLGDNKALNQHCLNSAELLWHSFEGNWMINHLDINKNVFEYHASKITATSAGRQRFLNIYETPVH